MSVTTDTENDPIMVARNAILEDLKARRKAGDKNVHPMLPDNEHRWYKPQPNYFFGQGKCQCPVCKTGELLYSRSGYNGHVHARCTTPDCVRWME